MADTNHQTISSRTIDSENTHPIDANSSLLDRPCVMRRHSRTLIHFNSEKISTAIKLAYQAVEGENATASRRVLELVDSLTQQVTKEVERCINSDGFIRVEAIQDLVERTLMRNDLHKVARTYILYREERMLAREAKRKKDAEKGNLAPLIQVELEDGSLCDLDDAYLHKVVTQACAHLTEVDPLSIVEETKRNLFNGVKMSDVHKAMIMSARTKIEIEPNYSFVAARLLLNDMHHEALKFLDLPMAETIEEKKEIYPQILKKFIEVGISHDHLSEELRKFDLEKLGQALKIEQDLQFTYLGLQTLYDRYFIHHDGIRFELPQIFLMRVAMGLAIEEKNKNERAIEFYNLLSSFDYMSSTPTLFNSATQRSQLSSCYLTYVPDDLAGIYDAFKENALLSKFAGGLGNDWSAVRSMGAHIKGTNGKSQGVVPFLKVANDTAVAVNQGGKRKGAVCAYLESWHLDVEEFIDLRKNTGDDRRRTHDMNTANWVPDLFMKRVVENKEWTLFSPDDTPDLHELYGFEFDKAYIAYEEKADRKEIKNFKRLPALSLWRKMLGLIYETGHPWITFKDPCNLRSPQQHSGVVHSSNLCTEITLNTSVDEIAVCNLGSVNLAQHVTENGIDSKKLEKTIRTAIRMLDNVIDINYYAVAQAKKSNLRHRPIGLGLMGFQDALYKLNIPYASQEAVEFADRAMEIISYYAIQASTELAEERGVYSSYEGSLWSQGILPIDSIENLKAYRGQYLDMDTSKTLDWDKLRERVKMVGMRNSNVMAIAPTATISNICGVTQSIEPTYQNLYVKSNLSGEFTVVNPYLVRDLKALNLWDEVLVNDLKYFDGSVQKIDRIPESLKKKYATSFEIDAKWLIEAASRRTKWIDQSQSLNIYIDKPSGKRMDEVYKMAWLKGLKTTYYCRALGASDAEKSTISRSKLNAVQAMNQATNEPKMCSIDDPECEACQ